MTWGKCLRPAAKGMTGRGNALGIGCTCACHHISCGIFISICTMLCLYSFCHTTRLFVYGICTAIIVAGRIQNFNLVGTTCQCFSIFRIRIDALIMCRTVLGTRRIHRIRIHFFPIVTGCRNHHFIFCLIAKFTLITSFSICRTCRLTKNHVFKLMLQLRCATSPCLSTPRPLTCLC